MEEEADVDVEMDVERGDWGCGWRLEVVDEVGEKRVVER